MKCCLIVTIVRVSTFWSLFLKNGGLAFLKKRKRLIAYINVKFYIMGRTVFFSTDASCHEASRSLINSGRGESQITAASRIGKVSVADTQLPSFAHQESINHVLNTCGACLQRIRSSCLTLNDFLKSLPTLLHKTSSRSDLWPSFIYFNQ